MTLRLECDPQCFSATDIRRIKQMTLEAMEGLIAEHDFSSLRGALKTLATKSGDLNGGEDINKLFGGKIGEP